MFCDVEYAVGYYFYEYDCYTEISVVVWFKGGLCSLFAFVFDGLGSEVLSKQRDTVSALAEY